MAKIGPYIIRLLFVSILPSTALIEALIKIYLWQQIWNASFGRAIFNNYFRCLVEMTADSRFPVNVSTVFFIKLFTTSKASLVLTWLNINLELLTNGCNQARYVSRGKCLECLPPLGKSFASPDKVWLGRTWWLLAWHGAL